MKATYFAQRSLAIVAIVALLFTGCAPPTRLVGDGNVETPSVITGAPTPPSITSKPTAKPFEAPTYGAMPVEITIPVYDRGDAAVPAAANYWTAYIQDHFGAPLQITITYVPIPVATAWATFQEMIAAGDAPDIFFSAEYGEMHALYQSKQLAALSQEQVEICAPEYLKRNREAFNRYSALGGVPHLLPVTRAQNNTRAMLIRTDWLDQAGLTMPKNRDEWTAMLKAWKHMKVGGTTTIPSTLKMPLSQCFLGNAFAWSGDADQLAIELDAEIPALNWAPIRDQLQYANELYSQGLIDPAFSQDTTGTLARDHFIAGNLGVYDADFATEGDILARLRYNKPTATVAVVPPEALLPSGSKLSGWDNDLLATICGINAKSKSPNEVLAYLNWLAEQKNLFTLQNGLPGINFDWVSAVPVPKEVAGPEALGAQANRDLWCLVADAPDYGSSVENLRMAKQQYLQPEDAPVLDQLYQYNGKLRENTVWSFPFGRQLVMRAKYRKTLQSKYSEALLALITCKPEDFETRYNAYVKEYMAAGYQEVIKEKELARGELMQ